MNKFKFYPIFNQKVRRKNIGILKDTLRVIMKRSKVPLKNMPDIVTTYIILYNFCIVKNKKFEDN
jgi:hypothetical protein